MTSLSFYIDDHALLFAWLARAVVEKDPDSGLELVENWVSWYGRERGARSARRCISNGQSLSVANYFVYSEWHDERGWNKSKLVSQAPYHFVTTECGWHTSWEKYGLLEYGQLYCRWVDDALIKGFNPEIKLEVASTLSCGAAQCSFYWPFQAFSEEELREMMERRAEIYPRVTRDFLYHMAHLYDVLRRVLIPHIGLVAANEIMERGLRDYCDVFGEEKARALIKASKQNFFII